MILKIVAFQNYGLNWRVLRILKSTSNVLNSVNGLFVNA